MTQIDLYQDDDGDDDEETCEEEEEEELSDKDWDDIYDANPESLKRAVENDRAARRPDDAYYYHAMAGDPEMMRLTHWERYLLRHRQIAEQLGCDWHELAERFEECG